VPSGQWKDYEFDRQPILLGIDGKYYAVDKNGYATVASWYSVNGKSNACSGGSADETRFTPISTTGS
jgi:hypothetical protein